MGGFWLDGWVVNCFVDMAAEGFFVHCVYTLRHGLDKYF